MGNHDTQPMQLLEAPVADWFKPLAYALILLRDKGYPCVFYPDLYGARYTDKDLLESSKEEVTVGDDGWADFHCPPGSVSAWVPV